MGCTAEMLGSIGTTIGIIGGLAAILFGIIAARANKRKEDRTTDTVWERCNPISDISKAASTT